MNEPSLSKRSHHLREAGLLRTLTQKVQAFSDGINLGQGVCDLEMPRALRLGAVESLFQDRQTYTPYAGLRELREEIARRTEARYGLAYGVDDYVVTIGSSMAYTATLLTLLDPGDEIILFEPFYPYHRSTAVLLGATVRTVPLNQDGPNWDAFRQALSPHTRAVVVNTPSNPFGKVWSSADIDRLAAELAGHSARIITDEIYEDLIYDGRVHRPCATHPGLFPKTITISGLSKSFSITGWRLGWLGAPPDLARAIGPVFDVLAVCAPRPLQRAAASALRELPESYFQDLKVGYARRRELLFAALKGGGFAPLRPEGAYYMLADYRTRYGDISSREACFRFLEETHIAAIPAELFWASSPPTYLRFQFAVDEPVLAEVARRLARRA